MAINHSVRPRRNESGERLIRRFTRKIKKLGLIEEVKERRHHTKKSDAKRRARQKAIARRKKKEQKEKKNTN
jgi:ribosomal protein S21|tara:strand:- start:203 stop:418 length:216 start_codon:yes stop_codon:yes gene_type:complete